MADLNHHQRDTLEKIFGRRSSGNVEWRQMLSLLEEVGSVVPEHNGKMRVTVGPESEVISPPHDKDVDDELLRRLKQMLSGAGLRPE